MSGADVRKGTVTNEADVGLPPLSAARQETWDSYRIEFLDDGYPARRMGKQLTPHPIYGTYVITDYLAGYRVSGNEAYLAAACRVADSSLTRMETLEDALVFMYEPNVGLSSLPHRFYSGLTQARYLAVFERLHRATGNERYRTASSSILSSLRIPTRRGGVARATPSGGLVIEEAAHAAPDLTLNGWTSATTLVEEYASATQDPLAREVFIDSCRGIREALPLFDVAELANSRYRLGGIAEILFAFSHHGAEISATEVLIPGYGRHVVHFNEEPGSLSRYLHGVDQAGTVSGQSATAEVFLSRVTWPKPNRVTMQVHVPQAGEVQVRIGQGDYDPLVSRLRTTSYTSIATVPLEAGENTIEVAVPWADAELVAYPTNFGKELGGNRHNVYHFIHIDTLQTLAERTGDDMFAYFADRWDRYVERWPHMPVYADADVKLHRYGTNPEREP